MTRDPEDRTDRLTLHRPGDDDVDELFGLLSDPRVWEHFPALRHQRREQTEAAVARWQEQWHDGLGTWVARHHDDGTLAGYGGCALLGGRVWNLGYRLAVDAQGRGLATELATRGVERALAHDADRPVVAYLLEHNTASAGVAERLGLVLRHRAPDAGNPDPGAVRLVYADRALDPAQLAAALA